MDNVKATQFCAISGFPGYYVSTDGKVFKGGKEVNPCYNGRGYNKVILYKDGQRKSRAVHRLIAETFIPNPYNLPVVNHINGNKLDNRIENLECVGIIRGEHAKILRHKRDTDYSRCENKPAHGCNQGSIHFNRNGGEISRV